MTTAGRALAVVDGTPAPGNDRRLDAVGLLCAASPGSQCGGWIGGTCTLIAPDMVLLARHCLDISTTQPLPLLADHPYRVRFRRSLLGVSENNMIVNSDIVDRDTRSHHIGLW